MSGQGPSPDPVPSSSASAVLTPPALPTTEMKLRRRYFGDTVAFYAPGLKRWQTSEWRPEKADRFLPVSVTGTACALHCDHCETKVLQGMIAVSQETDLLATARRLRNRGTEGILVSGGSSRTGEVPLQRHLRALRQIREELGMRVVVHTGLVRPEIAEGLAEAGVDGVMLDVIGAEETIREVYHLDLSVQDFERSLERLAAQRLQIIPHIVLGLHYGRMLGERNALEMISRYPVSTLILVVLNPLGGTPMGHLAPPPLGEVVDFFALARSAMPETPLNLGCSRPLGAMKIELDKAALDHGFNGIAYPAEGIIDYACRCGLAPELYEYCCSLTWTGSLLEAESE